MATKDEDSKDGAYYRINEPNVKNSDAEISTGSKRSKKKLIIVVSCVVVVLVAIGVLLLILLLGGDNGIESGYNGYKVINGTNLKHSYHAYIRRDNSASYPVKVEDDSNPEFKDLDFDICMVTDRTFRVSYRPKNMTQYGQEDFQERWTVPDDLMERIDCDDSLRLSFGGFDVDESPFGFSLKNPTDDSFWLSTKDRNLLFSDKYIEIGFEIHSQEIFGWGERKRDFKLSEGEYTIWTNSHTDEKDPGRRGYSSFGDHPFILARNKDHSFTGIFFKNSNAKVLKYIKVSQGRSVLNFRSVGGIIDIYAFGGDTAEEVLQQFHKVIGEPYFIPIWALGWQAGSSAYSSDALAEQAADNFTNNGYPLEVLWIDEQYMKNYNLWELNTTNFKNIKSLANKLNKNNQRLGLSLHPGYAVYDEDGKIDKHYSDCNLTNSFVDSATITNHSVYHNNFIGEGLPGKVAYLDFFHYSGYQCWANDLGVLHGTTGYNTIQLNMNEITQFCDGECRGEDNKTSSDTELLGPYDDLPYNPFGDSDLNLDSRTISMDSRFHFYEDDDEEARNGYNIHSIYGTQQAYWTYSFFWYDYRSPNPDVRSMVLSRSTFSGAGQYTSHFTSGYDSTFEDMKNSISTILNFQMFGIPHTGVEICGDSTTVVNDACARWYQLATFYPLARVNHHGQFGLKEPWGLEERFRDTVKNAMILRYSLIRYFYTIFYEIHTNGGSFWRPTFFEFPDSDGSLKNIEQSFMVGKSLLVTPVLETVSSNSSQVKTYIPAHTRFLDLINWTTILDGGSSGGTKYVDARWDFPIVHLREGRMLPYQDFNKSTNTYDLVHNDPINIVIFPDTSGNAEGTVYIDSDGVSEETLYEESFQYYKMTYNDRKIRFVLSKGNDPSGKLDANQIIQNITIVDAKQFNDTNFACKFDENMDFTYLEADYNSERETLNLHASDGDVLELRTLKGIQFGNNETDPKLCGLKYVVENVNKVTTGPMAGKVMSVEAGPNNPGYNSFTANFTLMKDNIINIDFVPDSSDNPFEMPDIVLNTSMYPITQTYGDGDISSYITVPESGEDFYFEVHTKDDPKDILFTTKGEPLAYTQYFKSMGSKLYTDGRMFGLGERVGDFWLKAGAYTIWNRGPDEQVEDNGEPPGKNLYGAHPVLFVKRKKTNDFFAIYDHNSSPQDWVFEVSSVGYDLSTVKASGRTNLFFILSGSIAEVTQTYYELVGKPILPPEWAFGWHQSRYGYNSTDRLKEVVAGYKNASIPLDAIWSDVDYLDNYKDFTLDEDNYKDLPEFIDEIHEQGIHWVPIIGAGISAGDSSAYFDGIKEGVFVKSNNDNDKPLVGKSIPGEVVFVDFFEPKSENFWKKQLSKLFKKLPFDGIWLDMNEITNYCDGVCYESQKAKDPIDNKLFYWPGGRDLEDGAISLDAFHYGKNKGIDTHNLYGISQSYRTKEWFDEQKQRTFTLSRSTFAGSGKYAAHWTGDNKADYDWMGNSVTSMHHFGFYGIPFVGSDVCGFQGNTSVFECAKWYKIGAIYPFSRNHNNIDAEDQEPYVEKFQDKVDYYYNFTGTEIMKKAALVKYALHVYTYSEFHKASTDGVPPIRPLFYDFPEDKYSYVYVESNVMIGKSIKASPHFSSNERSTYYFPEEGTKWCPLFKSQYNKCFEGGIYQNINIPYNEIVLHIRGGRIVPMQLLDTYDFREIHGINNLNDLANITTDLAVMFKSKKATGDVRFDGGVTTNMTNYDEIRFDAQIEGGTITRPTMEITFDVVRNTNEGPKTASQQLGDLFIYDASNAGFKDKTTGHVLLRDGGKLDFRVDYNATSNINRLYHEGSKDLYFVEIDKIELKANEY